MSAGLSDGDFDAYAAHKWRSNVYNRERLEVKQKLLAFARALLPRLHEDDAHLVASLSIEASVEHPALWNQKQVDAQHAFYSRNGEARRALDHIIERSQSLASRIEDTPRRNHVFLALTLAHERFEVALRLHPDAQIDRRNLRSKCEDPFERERLLMLLQRLPEPFQCGVGTADFPCAALDTAALDAMLRALDPPSPPASLPLGATPAVRYFQVLHTFPRAEVIAAGSHLEAEAGEALRALLPIYRFIAWSRDNDFVSMRDVLRQAREAQRQRGLVRDDRVRVLRGAFAGQMGVVQEVDGRGGVRLLVGKLAMKLDAADLEKR